MGMQGIQTTTLGHLQHAQAGFDIISMNSGVVSHHSMTTGYGSGGVTNFVEAIAGNECQGSNGRIYTSSNNTTGTKFFPHTKYWIGFIGIGRTSSAEYDGDIMCKGYKDHVNLAKWAFSTGSGRYEPYNVTNLFYRPIYGDIIYGKFDRIAIHATASTSTFNRYMLIRGPGNETFTDYENFNNIEIVN